jgi:hypothetical protein
VPFNQNDAFHYCKILFEALAAPLCDIEHVQRVTQDLKDRRLAPTFPEVRFCKGTVLPIVDTVTTEYLTQEVGASRDQVRRALRCEGFQTLPQYYEQTEAMSGYSGSPWIEI